MLHFYIDVLKEGTFWTEEVYATFDVEDFIQVGDFINENEIISIQKRMDDFHLFID